MDIKKDLESVLRAADVQAVFDPGLQPAIDSLRTVLSRPHGLLVIAGDVDPMEINWYETEEERDRNAKSYRRASASNHDDGIYPVTLFPEGSVRVSIDTYSGGFFE